MSESPENRIKRLTMRSWRRGMKEMDLILGPYADFHLARLSTEDLDKYEKILEENDQELYLQITALSRGEEAGPEDQRDLLTRIARFAAARFAEKS